MRALVGVDLQATGHEWLVERASLYAERLGAALDLVYFVGDSADTSEYRVRLESLMPEVPAERRGRARIESATPEDGFLHLSSEYDVLVVGSREPDMLERLLRGPMATRVLRHAKCSVLVPRGERAAGPGPRLLVGVDVDGPAPTRVLGWANRWASWLGGTVHVVYAAAAHRGDWLGLKDSLRLKLEAMLAAHVTEPHRGTVHVRRGEPEEVLIQMSHEYDLLLVGNREREGLARIMLGAVAASVVRRASCDVISLPTSTSDAPL
jgi:nucleotide-binding universal stress UspA family protein